MKKWMFLFAALLPVLSHAQEFAPLGAQWYYLESYFQPGKGVFQARCDTIMEVHGKMCKRIVTGGSACNTHFNEEIFVYDDGDKKVFFFNPDVNAFELLYDFDPPKDTSWSISIKERTGHIDTVLVVPGTVSYMEVNGHNLRRVNVKYIYRLQRKHGNYIDTIRDTISSSYVEKIGDLRGFLVNVYDLFFFTCDVNFIHYPRCYEDDDIGLYKTEDVTDCTIIATQSPLYPELVIQPNPVHDFLQISIDGDITPDYRIYSLQGRIMGSGSGKKVDFSPYPAGLYMLSLKTEHYGNTYYKIVKE